MTPVEIFDKLFVNFSRVNEFHNTITEISKPHPNANISAVEDSTKIFSFDDLCKKVHNNILINNANAKEHSSVDGFYYLKNNNKMVLIFIEFKIINPRNHQNYNEFLSGEIKPELKLKSLESLNCVLPHLISQYSDKNDVKNLHELIFKMPKYYYCVIYNPTAISESNARTSLEADFIDIKRLSPFPFDQVRLITPKRFKRIIKRLTEYSSA